MCEKVCTFFGHRDTPAEIYPLLKDKIRYLIEKEGVSVFMLGNKGNFDKFASRALSELKKEYPHIQVVLIVAYVEELNRESGISYFDSFDYPPEIQVAPKRFAMSARNRFLAKICHFAIIYVWREWGGAYEASKILLAQHKKTLNLYGVKA